MILAFQNKKKIQALAKGVNAVWADLDAIQSNTKWPVIFSGITTMALIEQARRYGLDYWYVDSGYMGNHKRKNYLRVCKNSIHASGDIIARPRDRLESPTGRYHSSFSWQQCFDHPSRYQTGQPF